MWWGTLANYYTNIYFLLLLNVIEQEVNAWVVGKDHDVWQGDGSVEGSGCGAHFLHWIILTILILF